MADDADAIKSQRRGQFVDVHGHVFLVVAGIRLGGSTGTAEVRNDDRVTLGKQRHDRMPHVAGLGVAVQ